MNPIESKLCDIQGRLFELSLRAGYDSESFVKCFMLSEVAKNLDSVYNRMQWAGEEYLLEEVADKCGGTLLKSDKVASKEEMYWMGYIYRYWHYYKGESSKKIYKQAPYERMRTNYSMFHTMAPEMAIDDLIEIYNQKRKKK